MNIIIRTCPDRIQFWAYLKSRLPRETIFLVDKDGNAMVNFLKSLELAGTDACLNMEDDIILTKDFVAKMYSAVNGRPGDVIQFFSNRKDDLTIGSRYDSGRRFMMNQCFYLPEGISAGILNHYEAWINKDNNLAINPTGYDLLMADYFNQNKMKYWIHCPSLVQHRCGESLINKKRSNFKRISPSFIEPDENI